MKYGNYMYSINISVKKQNSIILNETAEIANFHFSHYKFMKTLKMTKKHQGLGARLPLQQKQLDTDNNKHNF